MHLTLPLLGIAVAIVIACIVISRAPAPDWAKWVGYLIAALAFVFYVVGPVFGVAF